MKNLIAVGFLAALAACGGGGNTDNKLVLVDSKTGGGDEVTVPGCQVLTQMGCASGEKCTWVLSTDNDPTTGTPGLGANACTANGTKAIGAACTTQKVAMGGADDCVAGSVCIESTCKSICDNNGGTPACGTGQACVTYDGLFANSGSTTVPAGVCDPSCNPITDNDFDGSGTVHTKMTTTGCGADPTIGCYGNISSVHTTYFTCAHAAGGTGQLTHRSVIPANAQYLNSCMSGYQIAFAKDSSATTNVDCYAFCSPGDAYMGNPGTQAPNGVAPHRCNNQDALGNFGATASATVNGEHCFYSWQFEVDSANMLHRSPTSDTVGFCYDHTKYTYDDDNNPATPPVVLPSCASLMKTSATVLAAADLGCVSTATAGVTFNGKNALKAISDKRLKYGIVLPEFPALQMGQR